MGQIEPPPLIRMGWLVKSWILVPWGMGVAYASKRRKGDMLRKKQRKQKEHNTIELLQMFITKK